MRLGSQLAPLMAGARIPSKKSSTSKLAVTRSLRRKPIGSFTSTRTGKSPTGPISRRIPTSISSLPAQVSEGTLTTLCKIIPEYTTTITMETTLIGSQAHPTTGTSGSESPKSSRSSESPPTTGLRVSLTLMDPEDGCNNCGEKETRERQEKQEWSSPDSQQDPKDIVPQEDTGSTNCDKVEKKHEIVINAPSGLSAPTGIIWGDCAYCLCPIKDMQTIITRLEEGGPTVYHARCLESNTQLEKEREIYKSQELGTTTIHSFKNSLEENLWDEKKQRYDTYLEFRGKRRPIQVDLTRGKKQKEGSSKPAKSSPKSASP